MKRSQITEVMKYINNLLISKNYNELVNEDYQKQLTSEEIEKAFEDYGGNVTFPPDEAFESYDIFWGEDKNEIAVDFDLWIDNEKSDLTMNCFIRNENNIYQFAITGIHAL